MSQQSTSLSSLGNLYNNVSAFLSSIRLSKTIKLFNGYLERLAKKKITERFAAAAWFINYLSFEHYFFILNEIFFFIREGRVHDLLKFMCVNILTLCGFFFLMRI